MAVTDACWLWSSLGFSLEAERREETPDEFSHRPTPVPFVWRQTEEDRKVICVLSAVEEVLTYIMVLKYSITGKSP